MRIIKDKMVRIEPSSFAPPQMGDETTFRHIPAHPEEPLNWRGEWVAIVTWLSYDDEADGDIHDSYGIRITHGPEEWIGLTAVIWHSAREVVMHPTVAMASAE